MRSLDRSSFDNSEELQAHEAPDDIARWPIMLAILATLATFGKTKDSWGTPDEAPDNLGGQTNRRDVPTLQPGEDAQLIV